MYLFLVHIGSDFPKYLNDCILQARYFSKIPIILLIDPVHFDKVVSVADLLIVPLDDLEDDFFIKKYKQITRLDGSWRDGFWQAASLRFFYILSYAKKNELKDIFHIEYDNLIYYDFAKLLPEFQTSSMKCVLDAPQRCVPSFVYWRDCDALLDLALTLLDAGQHGENDMIALAKHATKYSEKVGALPIVTPNYPGIPTKYSEGYVPFGVLFDGAAVGQYVGGVDPRNEAGDTRGFINETTIFKCDRVSVTWGLDTEGRKVPLLNNAPLVNLHIHSKDLRRWMSFPRVVSGEQFQEICDVYCGNIEDLTFNPRIASQCEKWFDLAEKPRAWNNPSKIFVYSHCLPQFIKWIPFMKNKFCLISHNSDMNIDSTFLPLLESDLLICWYAQNVIFTHPKLFCLPIGIANSCWAHGDINLLRKVAMRGETKTRDFYFYFNVDTNNVARNTCKNMLEKKGLTFGNPTKYEIYLLELSQCKYAICPEGNGVDSHRLWECLYLGVIPIMVRGGVFTERFGAAFPCIIYDNWAEFDKESLRMKPINQINQNKLSLDYYLETMRSLSASW
jgi:hypothetical protein